MAESRGRVEDRQLRAAYRHIYTNGTSFIRPEKFQRTLTTHDLKVEPKAANVAGLQLADLLAYPVKRACLAECGRLSVKPGTFGARVVQCVQDRFNRRLGTGEVKGYGMIWLPVSKKSVDPAWEKAIEGMKPIRIIPRKERGHP